VCAAGLLLRHWQTGYYRAAVAAAATRRLQHFERILFLIKTTNFPKVDVMSRGFGLQ
jgi:hypothetical protein